MSYVIPEPPRATIPVEGSHAALDMTRRDLQAEAKRLARPWGMAKGAE